jgi:toxin ParE1/3/4
MTGYPDLLIYDAVQRPPLVMRILHGARDLPEALSDL